MSRILSFVIISVFAVLLCATYSHGISLSELEKLGTYVQSLKSQYDTFNPQQQKSVQAVEEYYIAKKLQLSQATTATATSTSTSKQNNRHNNGHNNKRNTEDGASTFSSVTLKNGDKFSLRQTVRGDLKQVFIGFVNEECNIPSCTALIDPILQDLLPEFVLIMSYESQATNGTNGAGNFDLLVQLLTFPGSDATVNTLITTLFGVTLYPSTTVSYFTSSDQYSLGFTSSNLTFSAQAYAILHTYKTLIEYQDLNGNMVYDAGEEVQTVNLGDKGWQAAVYNEIPVGKYTVHEVISATNDNVVTFTCHTSNYPLIDQNGQVIQPNGTKCNIQIQNFTYSQSGTYLALVANTVVAEGNYQDLASGSISVTPSNSDVIGGYYQWAVNAQANSKQININANVTTITVNPTTVTDFTSKFVILESGSIDARQVIFSFQTSPNPSMIFWDPSVGYGVEAVVQSSSASYFHLSCYAFILTFLVLFF